MCVVNLAWPFSKQQKTAVPAPNTTCSTRASSKFAKQTLARSSSPSKWARSRVIQHQLRPSCHPLSFPFMHCCATILPRLCQVPKREPCNESRPKLGICYAWCPKRDSVVNDLHVGHALASASASLISSRAESTCLTSSVGDASLGNCFSASSHCQAAVRAHLVILLSRHHCSESVDGTGHGGSYPSGMSPLRSPQRKHTVKWLFGTSVFWRDWRFLGVGSGIVVRGALVLFLHLGDQLLDSFDLGLGFVSSIHQTLLSMCFHSPWSSPASWLRTKPSWFRDHRWSSARRPCRKEGECPTRARRSRGSSAG